METASKEKYPLRPKNRGLSKEEFLKSFPAYVKLKRKFDKELKKEKEENQ